MPEPRIILWDLETSLATVAVFGLTHNDYIQPENIISERFIICGSWKVLGEKTVHSVSVLDNPDFDKDPKSDLVICQKLHEVFSDASVLIAHNGDSFDMKYLKARMLINGLPPLPPITTIDTLTCARKHFMFTANKLDYLGHILGVGRKKPTTTGLWLEVLKANKSAVREMISYNKQDVLLLERVFLKLRPFMADHINRELFGKDGCPKCGSNKIQARGFHRAISRVYRRFQCQACAGWFRSVLNEKDVPVKYRML